MTNERLVDRDLPLQPSLRPKPPWRQAIRPTIVILSLLIVFTAIARFERAVPRLLGAAGDDTLPYAPTVERLIDQADDRVWLMVYFIRRNDGGPIDGLCQALARAQARGVDVRVVLDTADNDWDPANDAIAAWLRDRDIRVTFDEPDRRTHAKLLLIDGHIVVIGSHNWSRSAMLSNREISVLHRDPILANEVARVFATVPGFTAPRTASPENTTD